MEYRAKNMNYLLQSLPFTSEMAGYYIMYGGGGRLERAAVEHISAVT